MNAFPAKLEIPKHTELEASILGGILLAPQALEVCADLELDDFYDPRHQVVFQAIRNIAAEHRPIDTVIVEAQIKKAGKLEAIGGVAFLGELALKVPTVDNVAEYVRIVRNDAANRRAMMTLDSAIQTIRRGALEPDEVISETIGELQRIEEGRTAVGKPRPRIELLSNLAGRVIQQSTLPEFDWGIEGLNQRAPMQIRSMSAITGPTGAGKTSLTMQIAAHRTRYQGRPAAKQGPTIYFLFELTPEQLVARRASQISHYTWRQVMGGAMTEFELHQTLFGETFFVCKPPRGVAIYDYTQAALDEVARYAEGEPLAVFDYLQRIRFDPRVDIRRGVSDIVDSLVDVVESRDMYALLVSKSSRNGSRAMRDGKTRGEDLVDATAETSAIEYGCANIIAITYENRSGLDVTEGRLEIAKGRFGEPGGAVGMRFYGASGRWEEMRELPQRAIDRDSEARVMAIVDATPGGFGSRNELSQAAGGTRKSNLDAIKRLLVPNGPLAEIDGRIVRRRT